MNVLLKRSERGFTLVELMISVTIGIMILAGVMQLYATSTRTQIVQEGSSRLQENARYVFARLEKDLSQTGFVGCFKFKPTLIRVLLGKDSNNGELYDFLTPLTATNDDGARNSDSLTLRYLSVGGRIPLEDMTEGEEDVVVDPDHGNYGSLQQYQIAVLTNCSRAAIFMITNDPNGSGGIIEHARNVASPNGELNEGQSNVALFESQFGHKPNNYKDGNSVAYLYGAGIGAYIYSIGDSDRAIAAGDECDAANPQNCALQTNGQELVEGVEDFQLELGWINAAGNIRFGDPSAAANFDWAAVDRIKMTLTLNTIETVPTAQGNQLHSKVFSRTVMIRNQLP